MPGTQKTSFTFRYTGGLAAKPGTGALTEFALADGADTVAANVVKSYRTADAVRTERGPNSAAYAAANLIVQNLQSQFRIGCYDYQAAASPSTLTFGAAVANTQEGTLPAAVLPLHSVDSVTVDGVAMTDVIYTTKAATLVNFPAITSTQVVVNPNTGTFVTGTDTSGVGAGIVFGVVNTPDLTKLKAQALLQPIEVVTFAGLRYNAQTYGMFANLVAWASANNLMVYAALDDSVPAPEAGNATADLLAAITSDSFQVVASKLIDPNADLTSAYAAQQAAAPPNGTLKNQPAPNGVPSDPTLPYSADEYGSCVDPGDGTFHKAGANCISLDGGAFVFTDDRCLTPYGSSTPVLFGGVRRTLNATMGLVGFYTNTGLTTTGRNTPIFDEEGLGALEGCAKNGLNAAVGKRFIDQEFVLRWPVLAETLPIDRKERALVGSQFDIRITTAIQVLDFVVEVAQ